MKLISLCILLLCTFRSVYNEQEFCTAEGDCGSAEVKSAFLHTEDDHADTATATKDEQTEQQVDKKQEVVSKENSEETRNAEEKMAETKTGEDKADRTSLEEKSKETTATEEEAIETNKAEDKLVEASTAETKTEKEEPTSEAQGKEEKIEEVDGILGACNVTVEDGQLYRLMMLEAGYTLNSSTVMKKYHCQAEVDMFMKNGFFQTTGLYNGEEVSIVAMMPSQGLQPHAHDTDEVVQIRYGEMIELMWPDGPGDPETKKVKEGGTSYMHSGFTHAIFAGPEGLVYHESLDTFFGRNTWFAPT